MLPDDLFANVEGFLSLPEATLLHDMAASVPSGSNVLEIGAYRGRSTCALALGAKEAGAIVYSVDNHPDYQVDNTVFGMVDNQAYYANLAHYGVGDVVRTINLPSDWVAVIWDDPIALLFIDGSHEYRHVKNDWRNWSLYADTVLLHDTAGYHEGVDRVVLEILASGMWYCVQKVDSISVFKRNKGK